MSISADTFSLSTSGARTTAALSTMDADKAKVLQALSLIPVGVLALVILGGVLWLQMQERRFEANRADKDRDLVMIMLRESVDSAKKDREIMQARSDLFLKNQDRFIKHQYDLVQSIQLQAAILEELRVEQARSTKVMESTLKRETQLLIDAMMKAEKR